MNQILATIDGNTAFKNTLPKLHTELMGLYEKSYAERIGSLKENASVRDIVLFFFDIHKTVARTIANQWGFDVRIALLPN